MKRFLLILTIAMSVTLGTRASESADSLACALATYWGSAFRTSDLSPAGREAFVKGLGEVLMQQSDEAEAYTRGATMGANVVGAYRQMQDLGMEADRGVLVKAIMEVARGGSVGFTPAEAEAYIDKAFGANQAAFTPESQADYLAAAAATEGAVTTPSGLVFIVLTEGEGAMPVSGQEVVIDYTGRLTDGTVFDSTEGNSVTFDVDRLVPGFSEGLKMMRPGGSYRIVIPPALAYGDTGAGGVIPPGAVIDFTVNLHQVKN